MDYNLKGGIILTFINKIIKKDVLDSKERKIGISKDFIASIDKPYPLLEAMVVSISKKDEKIVSWEDIDYLKGKIKLKSNLDNIRSYQIKKTDMRLTNILDKQIVDVNNKKIGRVNDIELSPIDSKYQIIGLGIGFEGLVRRLGIENVLNDLKIKFQEKYITWNDIDISGSNEYNLKLKVADLKLKKLHPADIASIIKELNDKDLDTILNSLDEDIAASILEEISSERQVCLVEGMANKKTAKILNKMPPDSATDLFGCLPEDRANKLLDLMNPEEASDIRKLLNYPPDTAGGIMTTDFAVINEESTPQEILDYLKDAVNDINFIYYIYLVSAEGILTGIVSLKDIIFSNSDKNASQFMVRDLITVKELENQNDVVKKIAKYNLLAVPVINDQNEIKGIVTVDDAIALAIK